MNAVMYFPYLCVATNDHIRSVDFCSETGDRCYMNLELLDNESFKLNENTVYSAAARITVDGGRFRKFRVDKEFPYSVELFYDDNFDNQKLHQAFSEAGLAATRLWSFVYKWNVMGLADSVIFYFSREEDALMMRMKF